MLPPASVWNVRPALVLSVKLGEPDWTPVAPRDEPKLDWNVCPGLGPRETVLGWSSVKVAPPSVDFQTPTPFVVGICETAPAVVDEMPWTPRPSATYIVLPVGSLGSIAMSRIDRLTKFALPPRAVHVEPPSVDL